MHDRRCHCRMAGFCRTCGGASVRLEDGIDDKIFAVWGLDFVFAFLLGIVFQYLAIAMTAGFVTSYPVTGT